MNSTHPSEPSGPSMEENDVPNDPSHASAPATNGEEETSRLNHPHHHEDQASSSSTPQKRPYWKFWAFLSVISLDVLVSLLFLSPFVPQWIRRAEQGNNPKDHFTLYDSLTDLGLLAALRLSVILIGLLVAYVQAKGVVDPNDPEQSPFELYHANGEKKSRDELELEALEEPFGPWFRRYRSRSAFVGEVLGVMTQLLCVIKCLVRMNYELGWLQGKGAPHPLFWMVVLVTAVLSLLEVVYLDSVCQLTGQYGKDRLESNDSEAPGLLHRIGSSLSLPLLSDDALQQLEEGEPGDDEEQGAAPTNPADVRGVADITADSHYHATWNDLLRMVRPDVHLVGAAFFFLLLAAIANVYIPVFLGNILDSLTAMFANDNDDDDNHNKTMFEVPGFMKNIRLLIVASICAGVFAGLRGSIFTLVGGRVNVRLRVQLMDALLSQDIGFFDVTKTGDITSRLSSDTTLVGDQVSLNVNVFLRSLVQALGVLLFMWFVSWQLTIVAFISVPLITILSKWYGNFVRSLTKSMQKKLADGNSVSEAALAAMPTIRAFDAAESELAEFESCMKQYLKLNARSAFAYSGYAAFTQALPQLVIALVVFYGGMLVRNGNMTGGQLVSFLLYLQSLSDAFTSIGWVFSSLTQAVGAADKVFELMNRKPRIRTPTVSTPDGGDSHHDVQPPVRNHHVGLQGINADKTRQQRLLGLRPETARGEIQLEDVEMYYPARPQRRILNGLSLHIEPGSIVALVGQSGGGKSSVMSLITHMYEQSAGRVLFDGHEVHNLSPEWISRHVSIVSQEPTLFGRSILRNLMLGLEGTDAEPTREEIEEAARLANADSFIEQMPLGYDTEVGERGVQLSGGQKQRIAIARALVRKPRLLLLDEATSALDAESEHLVQEAIDSMLERGREEKGQPAAMTVLIVAHRLSTVRNADKIFVIQEGQVVESGSHAELTEDPDGVYSALIRRQMESQKKLENGKEAPIDNGTSLEDDTGGLE